jgi:hypothetical protein
VVRLAALGRLETFVQDSPDLAVAEAEAVLGRSLAEDPGLEQAVQAVEKQLLGQSRELLEQAEAELLAKHRGHLRDAPGLRLEALEPVLDEAGELGRQGHVRERVPGVGVLPAPQIRGLAHDAGEVEQLAQGLDDEQRDPLGLIRDGSDETRRGLLDPEHLADELRHGALLQRSQRHLECGHGRLEAGQEPAQGVSFRHLVDAVDPDREDRRPRQERIGRGAQEPLEDLERELVGPLQIVEHKDERPAPGCREQRCEH